MPTSPTDWRLTGDLDWLKGKAWRLAAYRPQPDSDHEHCIFCWAKLMEGGVYDTLSEGYTTEDGEQWACGTCFNDFRERFHWTVKASAS
jgi:hypothetical protein